MVKVVNDISEISILGLINSTQQFLVQKKDKYSQKALLITESLYTLFFKKRLSVIGINHRLKSPESLKEKIIRKKLYKGSTTPEQVIGKMSDIIGIMIECQFISDEEKIFSCIKKAFDKTDDGVFYRCKSIPNIFINLKMPQPVRQKNGNTLYKLDCRYIENNEKINFELQIKSLVNSFWCEVEHNIVYKNNYFISSDDYVSEMLSAVRENLMGLDRILELIGGRISALSNYNVVKDLKLNSDLIKQMVSDLINAKMIDSVGFTVEAKRIRDLLSWYILRRMSGEDDKSGFYELSELFRELHNEPFSFNKQIIFTESFDADDIFSDIIGGKFIKLMNSDFEWHTFFVMLFQIGREKSREDVFADFVGTIRDLFCGGDHFKNLFKRLPKEDAQTVNDEAQLFIAEALCRLGETGILPLEVYKKDLTEADGFMQYTLNCLENINEWVGKRNAIRTVIEKSLQNE